MFQDEPALTPPSYCSSASRPNCACSLIPFAADLLAGGGRRDDDHQRRHEHDRAHHSSFHSLPPLRVLERASLSTLHLLYSRVNDCDREAVLYNKGEGA